MSAVAETFADEASERMSEELSEGRVAEHGMEFVVSIRRMVQWLLCIVSILVVTGGTANFITNQVAPSPQHKLARLMNRFDLAHEPSIPNWYSSFALLASGVLLSLIAVAKWRSGDRYFKHWLVLAGLFVCLSVDEGVRFHEMLHTVLVDRIDAHGIFYFPWVVPATAFVALVGLCYLPFLKHLDPRTRIFFLCAGALYVGGAVGMDMVGGVVVEQHGMESVEHTWAQVGEELLEMLGIVVFLYALMDHLRRRVGPISLRLEAHSQGRNRRVKNAP